MSYAFTSGNPFQVCSGNVLGASFATANYINHWAALTANSILVFEFWLAAACTVTSLTDSASNTYTVVAGSSDGTWKGWLAYCNNPSTNSSDYVVLNFSGGPSSIGMQGWCGELTGGPTSSPVGASNSATGTASAPTLSLTGVTSGSAIVAATMNTSGSAPGFGSGYTGLASSGEGYGYGGEYNLSSGSGSVTANFTGSSRWNLIAAAFSPPGGGGGARPSQFFLGASFLPLAWVIRRRQQRAKERSRALRSWKQDGQSGLLLPEYRHAA